MRIRNTFTMSVVVGLSLGATNYQPLFEKDFVNDKSTVVEIVYREKISIFNDGVESFSSTRKICGNCGQSLLVSLNSTESCFYPIRAKNESSVRWEDNCKICKKRLRGERGNQKQRSNSSGIDTNSIQVIAKKLVAPTELLKSDNSEAHIHRSDMLSNKTDSAQTEISFGEKLTSSQMEEAVKNFNNFITLLREEYGKARGEYLYVKKNRST